MNGYFKITIFLCLFLGLLLLFRRLHWLELMTRVLVQTREGMDEAARQRLLLERQNLILMKQEHSFLGRLEQELHYSGWKLRRPYLTAELFLAGNLVVLALSFSLSLMLIRSLLWASLGTAALLGVEYILLQAGKLRALRRVNDNLIKFLDFLGNYSITAGEITGIFYQVGPYMEEPIRTVLEECSMEAQVTGNVSLALLGMAEKVEHPKWKELVQNMEISARYSADFTALVRSSRRSIREYLRQGEERKGMLGEAVINMALLLAMSLTVLLIVDRMIEDSIWQILFYTLPGWIALGIVAGILVLFLRQIYKISR